MLYRETNSNTRRSDTAKSRPLVKMKMVVCTAVTLSVLACNVYTPSLLIGEMKMGLLFHETSFYGSSFYTLGRLNLAVAAAPAFQTN